MTKEILKNKQIQKELRRSIKRKKSTLAKEVLNVLNKNESLSARDITERIFENLIHNKNDFPEMIKKRMIVDLSKDFNTKLAERLEKIGVKREKNKEAIYMYSLK